MPQRIMVFNDTREILELFEEILVEAGYEVTLHAYSSRDLETVRRVLPDLLVSDHPPTEEKNGWQFVQKLRMCRETASIPVVICTTMLNPLKDNEAWLKAKGVVVVQKPFMIEELLSAVEEMVGPARS